MKPEIPPLPKRTRRPSSKPRQSVAERNRAAYDQEHLAAVAAYFHAAVAIALAKDATPAQGAALAASIAAVKVARRQAVLVSRDPGVRNADIRS